MHSPAAANRGRHCKGKCTENFCCLQKKFLISCATLILIIPYLCYYETVHSNFNFTINSAVDEGAERFVKARRLYSAVR